MHARTHTGGVRAKGCFGFWVERAEWLSGAPRGRVFENPKAEKEGVRRARFIERRGLKGRGEETRQHLRGSRVIARSGVKRGSETFVMPVLVVVMHLRVRLGRSRQPQRHQKARERRADEREAEHS